MVLEDTDGLTAPKIIYQPRGEENQISKFRKYVESKYGIKLKDYWELHEWSCKNYPEFWECVWQFFGIIHSAPYTEVFDRSRGFENREWFKGARFNFTENVFKYRDSHTAIIATGPKDNTEYITYREMYNEVTLYAAALKDMGMKKGDVVGCYMPNKKEPIIAFLATASIGALWCGALPLLGVKSALSRFQQVNAKVIFTSGNFCFDGKEINMMEKLKDLIPDLPTVEKVIFITSNMPDEAEDIENIPKCCTITEFLKDAREKFRSNPWDLEFEQVPFDYPLNISFTSGTTGLPKSIIHSQGGYFASLKDYGLHLSFTRKDTLMSFSPVGWISWNMLLNCLNLGITLVVYDGLPFLETPTRLWDLIDKFKLTAIFLWSSTADDMEKKGYVPNEKYSLSSLRQIFCWGSIMKPHSYDFLATIKDGVLVNSLYGVTEFYGVISGVDSNLPVYRGENQNFSLGMDVRCLDDKGTEIIGKRGSLVLANPYPGMPILLNDDAKQMIRKMYLSHFPGYWDVADEICINPVTKGFVIFGRADETLNPQGARFTCWEIYFALGGFPGISDSVCVSQLNKEGDERAVLFVKMEPGISLTHAIKEEIKKVIEENQSYEHVPNIIMEVPDIPYNLTGKKLNTVVKKLINKMPVTNMDFVINPSSLDFFKNVNLGDF